MEFLKWTFLSIGTLFYLPVVGLLFLINPILNKGRGNLYLMEERKDKVPWSERAEYFYARQ